MATIGYHASHEQFSPAQLLRCVQSAEEAGFGAAMCSDHFYPWSERQGESGHAWSWLGAALHATSFEVGVVTAPGQRYHPAVLAQAAATLSSMFLERFWLAVGSGEALNEHVTGAPWPPKDERNARLEACVRILRALFAGETVSCDGPGGLRVRDARLYSRPALPPRIYGAAISAETARWVAGWADGLITTSCEAGELRRVVDAFREGGGEGKPMLLQAKVSYAATDAEALANAFEEWRTNVLPSELLADLARPADLEAAAVDVKPRDVARAVRVSSDLGRHVDWIAKDLELGFEQILLHQVGRNQREFIDAFGAGVLPRFAEPRGARGRALG